MFASDRGCFTLSPSLWWSPANILINCTPPETRWIVLPDPENRTIVCSFFCTIHRNVTERQTGRRNPSMQCERVCKNTSFLFFAIITGEYRTRLLFAFSPHLSMVICHRREHNRVANGWHFFTWLLWDWLFIESFGTSLDSDVISYK